MGRGLHNFPLGAGVVHVKCSKNGYSYRRYGRDKGAFFIDPINNCDEALSNCFQGNLWRRLALAQRLKNRSLTSLQSRC